ncbi:C40 family peptidase [Microbacterium suaedae]|uniref:C40 family peptidase n=1 Tax=Microbacterium suaedae TaxID=2067813 RepID=UPI000DA23CC0|nr:C40 family peptidase [Microbacterium suaedae]
MSGLTAAIARIGEIETQITQLNPATRSAGGAPEAATVAQPSASREVSQVTQPTASAFERAAEAVAPSTLGDGQVTGSDVVEQAKKYLGVPYVFGGEDATGMDCSGLVQRVFADLGIDVPRVVQDQDDIGREVGSLAEAQPGDLLVPHGSGHIVIYIGDGQVLHAPKPGDHVKIADNWYSDADLFTIRRFVPADNEVEAPAVPASAPASTGADVTGQQILAQVQALFASQSLPGVAA